MHFASFLSGGFITAIVVNSLELKLVKSTSVQSMDSNFRIQRIDRTRYIEYLVLFGQFARGHGLFNLSV